MTSRHLNLRIFPYLGLFPANFSIFGFILNGGVWVVSAYVWLISTVFAGEQCHAMQHGVSAWRAGTQRATLI